MGKPRHSDEYYAVKEHYRRTRWEDREKFVTETKPAAGRAQRLADKSAGWTKDPHSDFKSPFQSGWHADHEWSLKGAHTFGGAEWSDAKKREFGHDISNIKIIPKWTNIEKGAKNVDKWLPSQNIQKYLLRRETTGKKYDLKVTKKQNKVYEKHLGRKSELRVGLPVEKTQFCTRCHINHSIGKHK